MPEWRGDVSEAEQVTGGRSGWGRGSGQAARLLGRPVGIVVEVTEWSRARGSHTGARRGPSGPHNIVTFESVPGGTQVTWTDDVELRGIFGLLEPLMSRMVRRGTRPTSAG